MFDEEAEALELLGSAEVFRGLTQEDLQALLKICKRETRKRHEVILNEGQTGPGLYIVIRGLLEVYLPKSSADGKERFSRITLSKMSSGACLGEYSLIDNNLASASVVCLEETTLFKITRLDFEELVDTSNRLGNIIYRNLLLALIQRLRDKDLELDVFSLA